VAGAVQTPLWLDLLAVLTGAASGALAAVDRRYDVAGVLGLAIVTGIGGGLIRDLLLNQLPVAMTNSAYLATAVGAAVAAFFFARTLARVHGVVVVCEAAMLAIFGVAGADKALSNHIAVLPAVLVGMLTAIGGGVLRDLLTSRPPAVFAEREVYALAALAGIVAFVLLDKLVGVLGLAVAIGVGITFLLRLGSWRLGWKAPRPVEAEDALQRLHAHPPSVRDGDEEQADE
jgi:uncharacterized membrane protein YeiH